VTERTNPRSPRVTARRRAVAISLLLALIGVGFVKYQPSLSPPGLHQRSLVVGTATAELMVVQPNLATGSEDSYITQVDHSVLTGDVMITPPVIGYAARKLGIRPSAIQASAPSTANVPRVVVDPGSGAAAYSLVGSTDAYKLQVQADPNVPILYVYGQGPSAAAAEQLVSGAIAGLTAYVKRMLPGEDQTVVATGIQQLGPIRSEIANSGASKEILLLVFFGVFGITMWLFVIGSQLHRGWSSARFAATRS
jgi:hypothetical protein